MKQIRRRSSAKGFTLIELLVVITIIGILAAIAIPGIAGALETARRNSATQNAKGLGNVFSAFAADNDQNYPGGAGSSTSVFQGLITGKYLPNGDSLFITGVKNKVAKWTGTGPLDKASVCWDVMLSPTADPANSGSFFGVNSSADDNMPLVFSTLAAAYTPKAGQATELDLDADGAFKTTGVVVLYKSMGAKFVKASTATPGKTQGFQSAAYADAIAYTDAKP